MTNLNDVKIRYVGKGKGTIPGVPARDMSNDEAREFDITALLRSGLYIMETPKRKKYIKEEPPQDDGEKDGEKWLVE